MPILCYVHRSGGSVPYFEVLPEMSRLEAVRRAVELLAQRPDGVRAELWDGEELVEAIERTPAVEA